LRGVGSPRLRFGERAYCLIWEITETEGEIWQVTLGMVIGGKLMLHEEMMWLLFLYMFDVINFFSFFSCLLITSLFGIFIKYYKLYFKVLSNYLTNWIEIIILYSIKTILVKRL